MAKFMIMDEVNDSYTADVLASGALETAQVYTNYYVNSGTASGFAVSAPCYLHSVVVGASANLGYLYLGDGTDASATGSLTSAGRVAKIDLAARGSYIFDSYVANKLAYRLTGLDCDGVTINYQLA
jgi:hypothetical protein